MPPLPGPPQLVIAPVTAPVEVCRIVQTNDQSAPAYADSFKSSAERGKPIRPRSAEATYAALHTAISVFDTEVQAASMATRFPALGDYVARIALPAAAGYSTARWGSVGHQSVWGNVSALAALDAAIVEVA